MFVKELLIEKMKATLEMRWYIVIGAEGILNNRNTQQKKIQP